MQKTAYDMHISDWSSNVCSSDLVRTRPGFRAEPEKVAVLDLCIDQRPVPLPQAMGEGGQGDLGAAAGGGEHAFAEEHPADGNAIDAADQAPVVVGLHAVGMAEPVQRHRSEEHTSELQSLMRI